jgi:Pin2-interacting protein X1
MTVTTPMPSASKSSNNTSSSGGSDVLQRLAGKKLRGQLSSTFNEAASTGVSSFARKQLERMGWTEGTGLGKRRDGMATHIKVQRRSDEQGGLGKTQLSEAAMLVGTHDWWKNSLEATLSQLSALNNPSSSSKKKDKKKKKDKTKKEKKLKIYTDEELFAATGGARFGMRAQAPQRAKFQRAEGGDKETTGTTTTNIPKAEWDGLSEPQVLLSTLSSSKRKKQDQKKRKLNQEDEEEGKTTEEDVSDINETEKQPQEEEEQVSEKQARKKAKKEKKEKKRLKKEKANKEQESAD